MKVPEYSVHQYILNPEQVFNCFSALVHKLWQCKVRGWHGVDFAKRWSQHGQGLLSTGLLCGLLSMFGVVFVCMIKPYNAKSTTTDLTEVQSTNIDGIVVPREDPLIAQQSKEYNHSILDCSAALLCAFYLPIPSINAAQNI